MNQITLTININEVNQILAALGKLPYNEVYQLVQKVYEQAMEQTKPADNQNPYGADTQLLSKEKQD